MIPLCTTENSQVESELRACQPMLYHEANAETQRSGLHRQARSPVRMAIKPRWRTMCCPSGMCNTRMGIKNLAQVWLRLGNQFLELSYFANLFKCENLVFRVAVDGKTCRIISTCSGVSISSGVMVSPLVRYSSLERPFTKVLRI